MTGQVLVGCCGAASIPFAIVSGDGQDLAGSRERLGAPGWLEERIACQYQPHEFRARAYARLPEDLAQVIVDGPRAKEELRGRLTVGRAPTNEARHMEFLRSELIERGWVSPACRLASGAKLGDSPDGPERDSKALECLQRGAQLYPRLDTTMLAPQPLAVEQLGTGLLERTITDRVEAERFLEGRLGLITSAEQRA